MPLHIYSPSPHFSRPKECLICLLSLQIGLFKIFHVNGTYNIWFFFCDWLLSFNIIFSSSIHVVALISTLLFFYGQKYSIVYVCVRVYCCCLLTKSCPTLWTEARQASLSFTISQSLFKLMSIELMMPSNHLILRHPFLPLSWVFPSIRVFSSESALDMRWPNCFSFSFSISPSNGYSGLISFRIDWFNLLAVLRNSQKFSPVPQLESISLALSLVNSPTLTSIHVY